MTQPKKKWTKEIQVNYLCINRMNYMTLLVSSECYLPILHQIINSFPTIAISISKVKDDFNTQYRRKNLLDPSGSHVSS
jgi:hypothetical protein